MPARSRAPVKAPGQSKTQTVDLRKEVADVIPHAVHDGVVGWRRGLCVLLCSLRRCVSVRWLDWADLSGCADRPYVGNRLRDRGLSFDSTLVDQGRFYAYPPYQHDELRIEIIRRRLCFRAVGQRRHEDLIDRLLILGEFGSCDFLLNLWCGIFAPWHRRLRAVLRRCGWCRRSLGSSLGRSGSRGFRLGGGSVVRRELVGGCPLRRGSLRGYSVGGFLLGRRFVHRSIVSGFLYSCRFGGFRGVALANLVRSCHAADFRPGRRYVADLQFAFAVAARVRDSFEAAVIYQNFRALRHDDAFAAELLFDPNRSASGANAHHAGGVESDQNIFIVVADGDRFRLNLRSVERERRRLADVNANDAAVDRD